MWKLIKGNLWYGVCPYSEANNCLQLQLQDICRFWKKMHTSKENVLGLFAQIKS